MNKILQTNTRYIAFACLFIPSVAFWCTGIIKDTIAICSIFVLTMAILKLIRKDYNSLIAVWANLLICCYILFATRPFLLICVFVSLFMILIFKVNRDKPFVTKFLTRLFGISITLAGIWYYFNSPDLFGEFSADSVFQTAEVIQKDMANNAGYSGKRYDLNINDFAGINLLLIAPEAIATTVFRPFIWEADTAFMLVNGLENLIILYFSFRFLLARNWNALILEFKKNPFYLYALFFALILGYFVGLTSGLFGTLVRLKTPLMPFFLLIIFCKIVDKTKSANTIG